MLLVTTVQTQGQIDISANWPNSNWTVTGTYTVSGFTNDPTTTAIFSFNDGTAGSGSLFDNIAAESPTIDITAATTANPAEEQLVITVDYVFNQVGDTLKIEWWDSAFATWVTWDTFMGNSSNGDFTTCSGMQTYVSQPLIIAAFSPSQLTNFKYRLSYVDNGHSFGWCLGSPTMKSEVTPLCFDVSAINADTNLITSVQAVLAWSDNNGVSPQDGWEIEYGSTGFIQGSGTTITTFINPYTISGLTPDTCYDVYVRALCSSTVFSTWTGPYNFCTPIPGIECGGVYLDSGGTGSDYSSGENTTTTMCPDDTGDVVTVIFTSFSTENSGTGCYDGLTIYNGGDTSAPTINPPNGGTEWCWDRNDTTPNGSGDLEGMTITSTAADGCLTFVFSSDGSVTRPGWEANIYCSQPPTCFVPVDFAVISTGITTADVSWTDTNGGNPTGGWEILYGLSGFDITDTAAGTVVPASANPFTIPGLTAATEYDYYVRAICGTNSGDDDSFFGGPTSFITQCDSFAAPYTENFESDGATPLCWKQDTVNSEDWQFSNDVTAPGHVGNGGNVSGTTTLSGGYFAWVEDSLPNSLNTGLLSPFIDLTGVVAPTLAFYYISNDEFFFSHVNFSVDVWNGTTWTDDVFTSNSNTNGWEQVFVDLSAFTGQVIQVRFVVDENNTGTRDDFAIDDVYIGEMPACVNVNAITIQSVGSNNMVSTWTDGGNIPTATAWVIEYGALGFTQGTGTEVLVDTNPFDLTGLMPQTDYEFYVRSDCGEGELSLWAGPIQFTTLCPVFDAPYTEDFQDGGTIDACWTQNANLDPWEFTENIGINHIGNDGDVEGTSTASGGFFAWVDDSFAHTTNNTITTPLVNLGTLGGVPAALSFYYISHNEGNTNVDFSVDVWDGTQWNVGVFTSNTNTAGWTKAFINLDLLTITGAVQARFRVDENNGNDLNDDLAIDDVVFDAAPACYPIYNTVVSNETTTTIDLAWTDTLNSIPPTVYIIEYGPVGFTQGSGTIVNAPTNPFTVTGLTPDLDYEFYVRASCTTTDLSDWTPVVVGTTLPTCLPVTGINSPSQTTTSVDIAWTDINTPTPVGGWDVEYVISTFPQGTGTTTTVFTSTTTISGLLPSTFYDIYIRVNCASDDSDPSRWVGPFTVQTIPGPPINDLCADAIEVTVGADCQPILGNNIQATQTTPILETECSDPAVDGLEPGFALDDIWYKFTMPSSGTVIIQTAFAGGMEDSAISVYSGACGNLSIVQNANGRDSCSDDADADLSAGTNADNNEFGIVQLHNQTPGEEFYVRVWSVDRTNIGQGNVHGQFTICIFGQSSGRFTQQLEVEEEEINSEMELTYYPNPVEDILTLKTDDNEKVDAVRIYSVLGQEVKRKTFKNPSNNPSIDLQDLQSGTYFVKISIGNKTKSIKVIKR